MLSWLLATEASPTTLGITYGVLLPLRSVQFVMVCAGGELLRFLGSGRQSVTTAICQGARRDYLRLRTPSRCTSTDHLLVVLCRGGGITQERSAIVCLALRDPGARLMSTDAFQCLLESEVCQHAVICSVRQRCSTAARHLLLKHIWCQPTKQTAQPEQVVHVHGLTPIRQHMQH